MARKKQEIIDKDKEIAKMLFVHEGLSRKAIADRLGYTEKTIGSWVTEGEWDKSKKTISYSKSNELQRLLNQLEELNDFIDLKPAGTRFPDSKEADIQKKINASIRDLEVEMNIRDAVKVSMDFLQFLNRRDAVLAKAVSDHLDAYLKGL